MSVFGESRGSRVEVENRARLGVPINQAAFCSTVEQSRKRDAIILPRVGFALVMHDRLWLQSYGVIGLMAAATTERSIDPN